MTRRVIGLAIKVHKVVGPGLYEHVYEDCLCHELGRNGIPFRRQVELPLIYEDMRLPRTYRADVVVDECIVLEIKNVDQIARVHEIQLLTYLRLSGCRVGLWLNFNTVLLKDGLRRFVQTPSPRPPEPPRPS